MKVKNIIAAICGVILIACMAAGLPVFAAETDDVIYVDIDGDGEISQAESDYAVALKAMQDYHERLSAREAAGIYTDELLVPEDALGNEALYGGTTEVAAETAATVETDVTALNADQMAALYAALAAANQTAMANGIGAADQTTVAATADAVTTANQLTDAAATEAMAEATDETAIPDGTDAAVVVEEMPEWDGRPLTKDRGAIYGPSGKEVYYNLNMTPVINIAQQRGIPGSFWVREDGVKMYGNYVMVAANYNLHPYGSLIETSLGTAIVLDTGGFAETMPNLIDVAVRW